MVYIDIYGRLEGGRGGVVVCNLMDTKPRNLLNHRLECMGFNTYSEYLCSEHWIGVRQQYAVSGLPQTCRCCGSGSYQLHHISYARLGSERLDELVPLCHACHQLVHEIHKTYKIPLRFVDDAINVAKGQEPVNRKKPTPIGLIIKKLIQQRTSRIDAIKQAYAIAGKPYPQRSGPETNAHIQPVPPTTAGVEATVLGGYLARTVREGGVSDSRDHTGASVPPEKHR